MSDRPVPAGLARRGLKGVTEALPAGQQLGGLARAFVQAFRPEIERRFLSRRSACEPAALPAACNPVSDCE